MQIRMRRFIRRVRMSRCVTRASWGDFLCRARGAREGERVVNASRRRDDDDDDDDATTTTTTTRAMRDARDHYFLCDA